MTARLPFSDARTMSLSASEFAASIAKLGAHRLTPEGHPIFILDAGSVQIRYEEAPPKLLGGLLSLPQARVTLEFSEVSDAARTAFLNRFDIAFQRGGG